MATYIVLSDSESDDGNDTGNVQPNKQTFINNLQAVAVDTLPEDDRSCGICMEVFIDGQRSALRYPCDHLFCRPCTESLVDTAHLTSQRCPTCRHQLWEGEVENVQFEFAGDEPPAQQAYTHFTQRLWETRAVMRVHLDLSLIDRQRVEQFYHAGRLIVDGPQDRRREITSELCDEIRQEIANSPRWSAAAARALLGACACQLDPLTRGLPQQITLDTQNCLRIRDHSLAEQYADRRQRVFDRQYKVYRWNEIQMDDILRQLHGFTMSYHELYNTLLVEMLQKMVEFHQLPDYNGGEEWPEFTLAEHFSVVLPLVHQTVHRFASAVFEKPLIRNNFASPVAGIQQSTPWLPKDEIHVLPSIPMNLYRPGGDRNGVAGQLMWRNPLNNDEQQPMRGPYWSPLGDGRRYYIDETIKEQNPPWVRSALWLRRPIWSEPRTENVYLIMRPPGPLPTGFV